VLGVRYHRSTYDELAAIRGGHQDRAQKVLKTWVTATGKTWNVFPNKIQEKEQGGKRGGGKQEKWGNGMKAPRNLSAKAAKWPEGSIQKTL